MSLSITLSTRNFSEASKIDGKDEFHFIIGNQEVLCHKYVAAFLSHSISHSLLADPTFNSFNIDLGINKNAGSKQQCYDYIKNSLEKLILGINIEITEEELQKFNEDLAKITKQSQLSDMTTTRIPSLLILFKSLNNEELKDQLYTRIFQFLSSKNVDDGKAPKKYTKQDIENKINQIQKVENFFNLIESNQNKENFIICVKKYLKQEYEQIIDDIAFNLHELEETSFNEMNDFILDSILSSQKLQIKNEDSLLQMLLNRRQYILSNNAKNDDDQENTFFIEKVHFEYLTEKSMETFLNEIQFNEIDINIWNGIKKRLVLPVKINSSNNKRFNSKNSKEFEYDNQNPFNGIFHHLTQKTNGNIQTNKTIEIKCSRLCCGQIESLVDFNNPKGFTHVYHININEPLYWLQFDFKSKKVQIDSYLIKSADKSVYNPINALKSWQVEISEDGNTWKLIDKQENVSELNGENSMKLFSVSEKYNPSRFVRIITDKDSWTHKKNGFTIRNIEFFGQIFE